MFITPIKLVSYDYAGGGVALLYASKALDKLQTANFDQKIGVQIIQNALKVCEKIIIFLDLIYFPCVLISELPCRHQCIQLLAMQA